MLPFAAQLMGRTDLYYCYGGNSGGPAFWEETSLMFRLSINILDHHTK